MRRHAPHCRPHPRPGSHPRRPDLDHLLDLLVEGAGLEGAALDDVDPDDTAPPRPVLVGFGAGEPAPAAPPRDTGDPVRDLVGFDAPASWEALAVVLGGTARADGHPDRRVLVALAVARDGETVGRTLLDGGPASGRSSAAPEGRLVDVCRLAMGLPTPPPPPDSTGLWARAWLDRLLEDAAAGDPPRTWTEATRRHVAVRMLREDPDVDPALAVATLEEAGAALGRVLTWPRLRAECAAGAWAAPELHPDEVGWLDDGAFARWVEGGFLPLGLMRDELDELLAPPVLRGVDRVLGAWGLDDPPAGQG